MNMNKNEEEKWLWLECMVYAELKVMLGLKDDVADQMAKAAVVAARSKVE